MASPILSYRPEVRIIIGGLDLTRHLGDAGTVLIQKGLYAPTGEFHITLPDMPTDGRDSLYGLLKVMSSVEIRMRRWVYPAMTVGPWVTVLRGFLRSIGRKEEVVGDGRVQRQVELIGHDTGSAFIMEQLSPYITYQNTGLAIPAPLTWLVEYDLISKPYRIADFIWEIAYRSTLDILACAGFAFEKVLSVEHGTALANQAISAVGPVWELLSRYADRPWNELFVREGETRPELVFRPTPWRDSEDQPLPDSEPGPFHLVPAKDVVSLLSYRDDAELVNHAWVMSPPAIAAGNVQIFTESKGTLNADTRTCFGDRLQIESSYLGPDDTALPSINLPAGDQSKANTAWTTWVMQRLEWLKLAGEDTHKFERGSVTFKGNPSIRVGDYITVERGALKWDGYAIGVRHHFQPYQRYLTTVEYIRGNQWMRRRNVQSPWDKERKTS